MPGSRWTAAAPDGVEASLALTPVPAQGWTFDGWTDCTSVSATICTLRTVNAIEFFDVTARFVDRTPPEVEELRVTPSSVQEGAYVVTWRPSEPGLQTACSVDGAAPVACTSGFRLEGREGTHTFTVESTDPSGNVGAPRTATFDVVDTVLGGPNPGIEVRSAAFSAMSVFKAQFECSLDGEAYRHCGSNQQGAATPLTLPALAIRCWSAPATGPSSTSSRRRAHSRSTRPRRRRSCRRSRTRSN